jgi:hypothetical protein
MMDHQFHSIVSGKEKFLMGVIISPPENIHRKIIFRFRIKIIVYKI